MHLRALHYLTCTKGSVCVVDKIFKAGNMLQRIQIVHFRFPSLRVLKFRQKEAVFFGFPHKFQFGMIFPKILIIKIVKILAFLVKRSFF